MQARKPTAAGVPGHGKNAMQQPISNNGGILSSSLQISAD